MRFKEQGARQGYTLQGSLPAPGSLPGRSPGGAEPLSPCGGHRPQARPGLGPGFPAGHCSFLSLETRSEMLGSQEEGEEAEASLTPQGSAKSTASHCLNSITVY